MPTGVLDTSLLTQIMLTGPRDTIGVKLSLAREARMTSGSSRSAQRPPREAELYEGDADTGRTQTRSVPRNNPIQAGKLMEDRGNEMIIEMCCKTQEL